MICVCANIVKKPISPAGKGMNFAARDARTNITSTSQEKRKRGTNKHYFFINILLSILAKPCHYDKIYMGVTKTGSGSPFAKMSTF